MKNALAAVVLLCCVGCGGGGGGNSTSTGGGGNPSPASIGGKWQIIATSTQNPGANFPYAGIEAILSQTDTSVSAGNQAALVIPFYLQGTSYYIASGDACGDYLATISGTISSSNITITLTEGSGANTYVVSATGTISNNNTKIAGTYSAPGGCGVAADSGTFVGTLIPSVSGNYNVTFGTGTNFGLSLTEDSNHNLTASGTYQGSSYTLTGETVGGAIELQGTIPGYGSIQYVGFYFDSTLVSLVPTVGGISTRTGDFIIFGSDGSVGFASKQ